MPRFPRSPLLTSIIAGGGLLFLSAAPGGCRSEKQLVISDGPYIGPAVRVDSAGPQHLAVVSTPGGGWAVQLDQTRQQFQMTEVFITARRPNPALLQNEAIQEHLVATTVPASASASVYVRTLGFKEGAAAVPYRLACRIVVPAEPPAAAPASH
jgi:hypothetical protein